MNRKHFSHATPWIQTRNLHFIVFCFAINLRNYNSDELLGLISYSLHGTNMLKIYCTYKIKVNNFIIKYTYRHLGYNWNLFSMSTAHINDVRWFVSQLAVILTAFHILVLIAEIGWRPCSAPKRFFTNTVQYLVRNEYDGYVKLYKNYSIAK